MSRRAINIMIDTVLYLILAWNAGESAYLGSLGWTAVWAIGATMAASSLSIYVFPGKPRDRSKTIRPRWKL